MTTILKASNLSMVYPNGVQALKNINLEVREGEFLVVIGLSGSGKSTLLRCLNHLLTPTSGQVDFQGRPLKAITPEIAMIFQHFNLISRLSVKKNVLMGKLPRTPTWKSLLGWFSSESLQEARNYLDLVGIGDKSELRADQLSGGQQQRVAIARALCQMPKVLLADEPVASLDPATCHVVMDYLRKVNRDLGITVVCNLHFLSLVREYATRVVALRQGELVFEGRPEDISASWFIKIYGETARDIHVQ